MRRDPLSGVAIGTDKKPPPLGVVVHSRLSDRIDDVKTSLSDRIDGVESRIDNLESRIDEVRGQLTDRFEARIAKLERRLLVAGVPAVAAIVAILNYLMG